MSATWDAIDDFAGPGGWSVALALLGLTECGYEWDKAACETARAAGFHRCQEDVSKADGRKHRGTRLYIASPPCTLFSTAGKGTGRDAIDVLASAIRSIFAGIDCRQATRDYIFTAVTHPARIQENDARKPEKKWAPEKVEKAARNDVFVACLVLEPARRILEIEPEMVAMEQVPAVLPLWEVYAECMTKIGYSCITAILNAADFGVPQTRKRAIYMAVRDGLVQLPRATHAEHPEGPDLFGDSLAYWVSMADALGIGYDSEIRPARGEGMTERHGERPPHKGDHPSPTVISKARSWAVDRRTNSKGPRGTMVPTALVSIERPAPTLTSKAGEQWVLRMGNQAKAAERRLDEPAPTVLFGHRCNSVEWIHKRPATTIVSSFGADTVSPPGYRTDVSRQNAEGGVKITVAEGGVLQSFPADYPWQGSRSKQFEQVGNAIPPLLAAHILSALTGIPLELEVAA